MGVLKKIRELFKPYEMDVAAVPEQKPEEIKEDLKELEEKIINHTKELIKSDPNSNNWKKMHHFPMNRKK